jgi:hypothetical protein
MPLVFDTTLETIPATTPYIHQDSALVQKWRDKVQQESSKLKIGLVWVSGIGDLSQEKSFTLDTYSPLIQHDRFTFYSLQKGRGAEQAKNPPDGMNLIDHTEEINDFSDTAVVHLTGAIGKPIWTLLPFEPIWQWMLHREDSPWYPTMRLFRQPSRGDWESVIAKVKDELVKLLGTT